VLIYCYEVLKVRSVKEIVSKLDLDLIEQASLLKEFQDRLFSPPELLERQNQIKEAFVEYLTKSSTPKLAFNMATGSGKTMVMAMAIAWMYLNNYSRTFLMICPNTIFWIAWHWPLKTWRYSSSSPSCRPNAGPTTRCTTSTSRTCRW